MRSAASPLLQAIIFMQVTRLQMDFWLHGTRIFPGSSLLFAGRFSTCSVPPKCDPDGLKGFFFPQQLLVAEIFAVKLFTGHVSQGMSKFGRAQLAAFSLWQLLLW